MSEHSKLMSPSASGVWINCTAQPQALIDSGIPNIDSPESALGTLKHDLSEETFVGLRDKTDRPDDMDVHDWDEVVKAVDAVEVVLSNLSDDFVLSTEMEVGFEGWRSGCFGKADIVVFDKKNRKLYIIDYKFGRVAVGVEGNTQLMIYALAAIETLAKKFTDIKDTVDTIELAVVQPKLSREAFIHTMSMKEILAWDDSVLTVKQHEILDGKGTFQPGKHCSEKYCDLFKMNKCSYAYDHVDEVISGMIDLTRGEQKLKMTDDNLNFFVALAKNEHLIKKTIEAAWAELYSRATSGERLDDFKIVKGKGKRGWKGTDEEVVAYLKGKIPAEEMYKKSLITAPQAETLLKTHNKLDHTRSKNIFNNQVEWTDGRPILVSRDNPKEEIFVNVQQDIEEFFGLDVVKEDDGTTKAVGITDKKLADIDSMLEDMLN